MYFVAPEPLTNCIHLHSKSPLTIIKLSIYRMPKIFHPIAASSEAGANARLPGPGEGGPWQFVAKEYFRGAGRWEATLGDMEGW